MRAETCLNPYDCIPLNFFSVCVLKVIALWLMRSNVIVLRISCFKKRFALLDFALISSVSFLHTR